MSNIDFKRLQIKSETISFYERDLLSFPIFGLQMIHLKLLSIWTCDL